MAERNIPRKQQTRMCARCGAEFKRNPKYSDKQWSTALYCGRRCGAWNLGLTKDDDPRIKRLAEFVSVNQIGRAPWNKGLTKHDNPILAQIAEKVSVTQRGRKPNANQLRGLEAGRVYFKGRTKDNCKSVAKRAGALSKKYKGRANPKHSKWLKAFYKENPHLHPNAVVGRKTKGHGYTYIEKAVSDWLGELGIDAKFNYRIGSKWADFALLDRRLIIEADGERWHQDKEKEAARDKYLNARGWQVLHLSGMQIVNEPEACKKLILDFLRERDEGQLRESA